MNTERTRVGWGFWLWWVLACTVGLTVAFAVAFAVTDAVSSAVAFAVTEAVVGAVVGASVGIAQWLVLRRQVSRPGWWVLASIVGFAGDFAVAEAVFEAVEEAVGSAVAVAVGGAVVGASVGIAQWLVLRRQVSRPGWWVLASIMGLAVAFALSGAFALGGALGLVVYGAITGAVMVWLLRQPVQKRNANSM